MESRTNQSVSASGSSDTSLSQQMRQNISNMNDLVGELQLQDQQLNTGQEEQFNKERLNLLLQLQQEMSFYATIQEKFDEHEKSMQMIIQELQNEQQALSEALDEALADSTDNLEDLNNEVKDLNKQLGNLSEDNTCAICLFQWTTEGEHCLVSLRCGHLFGRKCIRRSVRMNHKCPICQKNANWRDIRKIYCSSGIMASNSENESTGASGYTAAGSSGYTAAGTRGYTAAGASGYTAAGTMGRNMYYDSDDSF